jgi:Tol biopolymer transport system component
MALGGDRDALLQELSRINSSSLFRSSDRLRRLLHFLVIETVDGRAASLKEYTVGLSVFDKPESFDPKVDSTVRSEVSKLRSKLRLYYETEGSADPVVVSIPKGGYSAEWHARESNVTAREPIYLPTLVSGIPAWARSVSRFRRWIATGFLSIGMLSLPLWINRDKPGTQFWSIPVTSGPRAANNPSFSPDGSQIAFSSDMADPGNLDIFIKSVDSGSLLRLTSDPASDSHPAWSPDGKSIAFVRNVGYGGAVYLVSVGGGPERRLRNVNLAGLAWFPDGNHLAALHRESNLDPPAFLLIDPESLQSKALTRPPAGWADYGIALSPDGARAAVERCTSASRCDIYLADVRPDRTLAEPFRRVTWLNQFIHGIAWAGDNSTIVFSAGHYNDYRLLRLDTRRIEAGPKRVNGIMTSGHYPSIPLRGPASLTRIAFVASTIDENMWAASLANTSGQPVVPARQLAPSPRGDWHPWFSADGTRLVFASDRSGTHQVWVGSADGTNPHPITRFDSGIVLFPQFSPVSDDIAFVFLDTKNATDERGIYTIRADGTGLRRITSPHHQATEHSWSADGKWIYFTSPALGFPQIWKVAATGGSPKQVTRFGGYRARESNGVLYYVTTGDGVWSTGVNGGPERKVLPQAQSLAWFAARDGLLFVPPSQPDSGTTALSHWNAATGTIQPVARLPHPAVNGFSFFEKTSTILYARTDYESHDIIVLENYDSMN